MATRKYRKIPVVIEAVRFDGQNVWECLEFAGRDSWNDWPHGLIILTLEGSMTCAEGDWLVRGIKGEIYPVKPDIFIETYEPVSE